MDRIQTNERTARPFHGRLSASIEQAAGGNDERFRVRGIANTFTIMHSGRMFHPRAFDRWIKANAKPDLALMGQHGYGVEGFSTIGRVDAVKATADGLAFEGWIARGSKLADEARRWSAKALRGISVGWNPRSRRWVKRDDADIDPAIAEAMDAKGVNVAEVHLDVDLLEISIVDVGDDSGARLAAKRGGDAAGLGLSAGELRTLWGGVLDSVAGRVVADLAAAGQATAAEHLERAADGSSRAMPKAWQAVYREDLQTELQQAFAAVPSLERRADIAQTFFDAATLVHRVCMQFVAEFLADPYREYGRLTAGDDDDGYPPRPAGLGGGHACGRGDDDGGDGAELDDGDDDPPAGRRSNSARAGAALKRARAALDG